MAARRGVLKFFASAGAGAASSGLAAPFSAVSALTSTTLSAAIAPADRAAKTFELLGRAGGFPTQAITSLFSSLHGRSRYTTIFDPNEDLIAKSNENAFVENMLACINGHGTWRRQPMKSDKLGKIIFDKEVSVFEQLSNLPRNIPLLDLLSDDVFLGLEASQEKIGDSEFKHWIYKTPKLNLEDIRNLRQSLLPLCGQETTAQDLVETFQKFFRRLAKHAIDFPDDFDSTDPFDFLGLGNRRSSLEGLLRVLNASKSSDDTVDPLIQNLKKTMGILSKKREEEIEEHFRRNALLQKETTRMIFENERKARILRCQIYNIEIFSVGENRFVLCIDPKIRIPTRVDWFYWLQTIDPDNAKPSDIELDNMGATLTIKNAKALEKLRQERHPDNNIISVALPNRRDGGPLIKQEDVKLPVSLSGARLSAYERLLGQTLE